MAERILVVGPPDVGKSTLSRALAAERGLDLLDLDVGQGDLPGAVTLFSKAGTRRLLVGRISPAGAEGWLLAASARLARLSDRGFVADTDGWLNARFRYQQAEALGANAVIAFDERLFAAYAWRKDLAVRRQGPLPGVRPRSPAERRAQRRRRSISSTRTRSPGTARGTKTTSPGPLTWGSRQRATPSPPWAQRETSTT